MSIDILTILIFLFYEIVVLFSSIRLFFIIAVKNSDSTISIEKSVIGWIALSILLSVSIASVFSFMQFNGQIQYLLGASVLLVGLHVIKKSSLNDFFSYVKKTSYKISKSAFNWKIIVIFILVLPMLWFGSKPSSSADTLGFLNPTIEWSKNQLTPYTNLANYIPFNQLSWIPSIVITSSDNYFWLSMIKPIILLGLVTYTIGNVLKLNKNLIWLSVFSSLVFYRLWLGWGPAFGSIKEDALIGTGVLLIAYSTLIGRRDNLNRLTYLFLLLGIIFVAAKWPGLFIAILALPLFVFYNWKEICEKKRTFFVWFGITILVFMLLIGHIHIQHTLEYGHPFYPVKATIFGIELPGTIDSSKKSIMANIDDIRVWQILYPPDKISPGGLLFPLTLAFGTFGCITLIVYNVIRYFRKRNYNKIILYLSIFILMTWLVYFNIPFTACQSSDPECEQLTHITDLHSMRMQDGGIFLTEIFFVFVLVRLGVPYWIVYGIVLTNLISRLFLDYMRMKTVLIKLLEVEFLIYPIVVVISLFFIIKYVRNDVGRVILVCSVGIIIFAFMPQVVDDLRVFQTVKYAEVRDAVHELPPSKIFLINKYENIDDFAGRQTFPVTYPIYGDRFQHEIKVGSFSELENILQMKDEDKMNNFDYIAFLCHQSYQGCSEVKEKLADDVEKFNFIEKANAQMGILFETRE